MKLFFKLKIMKEPELLLQPMNPKGIKILYESLKQDIINLNNIKMKFNSVIKKNNIINSKILINFGNSNFPKKLKMKNMTMRNIEKMIYHRFIKCYQINQDFYNIKVINEIISNEYSHIVSKFKDYLIEDDTNEFIHKLYKKYESIFLLKQIFIYYNIGSVVYPNYILLPEKRYIYKNIKKKQKIIDLQEQENIDKNKEKYIALSEINNDKGNNADRKVFDSKIIESILNQSNTSNLKNIFYGLSNENSMDFDIKKIYYIVKKINKIEEENNNILKLNEKNKNNNNNNNKVNNQNNNDLSNGQAIINNLQVKNIQNIKHSIFNENNQLNKKENNKTQNEQSNNKKINTNNTSDFKLEKLKFDLRNINREGNLYSLCLNKNKVERINNIKNIINSYYNNKNKKNANSLNSILKNKKVNQYSRNHRSNILDSVDNIKMNTINYFIKNDSNNNKNNLNLINEKSNIKAKNIIENKEKINKSNKSKLTNINKNIFPKIFNLKEPNQESIIDNNNRQIKKSIIEELLSSISSCKETWRNSKLTESNREFSHLSMNISDKGKLPVNNLNLNNQKEFENKTKVNISDNFENISKVFHLGKNKKENSSGIDFSCINKENINVHKYHTSIGKKIKKRINKMNSFNVNIKSDINNIKNPVSNKRNREHNRYFSKQIFNSDISNLINKERNNYSKKDKIINSTNKNNNKDNLLNTNSIINIKKNINYNFLNNKNSRNIPSSYLYDKNNNNTLSIIKKSKYININSINNNGSNIKNIKSFETISSMGSMLQDKTKLNFDSLKLTKFKKQNNNNNNSNTYKKMCLKKINFNSERNIDYNHLFKRTNKIILNSSNNRRQNDLFPLSARISGIMKDESNNLSESVNNLDKSKLRNLKYSLNENNPITNNYVNDFKNKKLNINFVSYNNLTHSTIKEEKKIIKKMKTNIIPELNLRPNNRKKITSNILSLSNGNNTDMNLFKTLNSTISKFSNSLTKKNNAKINDNFNLKKNNLLRCSNTKNNFKKSGNNTNIGNHYEKINKNTQHYWKHLNINEAQKNKNNKDKNFTNRISINDNNKRHYKFNSTQFFMDGSSNFDSLKYYSLNYNSIPNKTYQNKAKYLIDPKNNKKGKNFKNNINKIKDLQIGNKFIFNKSKKKNIFPISITERNRQIHLLSPINRIKENIKNKK